MYSLGICVLKGQLLVLFSVAVQLLVNCSLVLSKTNKLNTETYDDAPDLQSDILSSALPCRLCLRSLL